MPHRKSMKSGKFSKHHGKGVHGKIGVPGPAMKRMHHSVGKRSGPKMVGMKRG